jgi:hypothetical protein
MAKPPSAETIADVLTVPERILLFCLASDTDWRKAGVTHTTAQHMLRGLTGRDGGGTRYVLTDHGRAVLEALLSKGDCCLPRNARRRHRCGERGSGSAHKKSHGGTTNRAFSPTHVTGF